MEPQKSLNSETSYKDVLQTPDIAQAPEKNFYTYVEPHFDSEFIKKDLLNLFLDTEKKNQVSINEGKKTELYGVVIGEASKKGKLYERLRENFQGFNTKSFVEIISKVLIHQRDRESLLATEKRDSFDLGKFKVTVLSFGDYFAGIIYQSNIRSAGASKLEGIISKTFKKQNYLDASVIRNNILDTLDKDVDRFIESLPSSKGILDALVKLVFMTLFTAVTLNKVYEWNAQNLVNSDFTLKELPLEIDRSLFLNSYLISGTIPHLGYKAYLRKKFKDDGIQNIRWDVTLGDTLNLETADMRVQVVLKKLNKIKGFALKRTVTEKGIEVFGYVQSPNQLAKIDEYIKRFNLDEVAIKVTPDSSQFINNL